MTWPMGWQALRNEARAGATNHALRCAPDVPPCASRRSTQGTEAESDNGHEVEQQRSESLGSSGSGCKRQEKGFFSLAQAFHAWDEGATVPIFFPLWPPLGGEISQFELILLNHPLRPRQRGLMEKEILIAAFPSAGVNAWAEEKAAVQAFAPRNGTAKVCRLSGCYRVYGMARFRGKGNRDPHPELGWSRMSHRREGRHVPCRRVASCSDCAHCEAGGCRRRP
jgi:hypothetical protein